MVQSILPRAAAIAAATILLTTPAFAAGPSPSPGRVAQARGTRVEVWIRAPGQHASDDRPKRIQVSEIDFDALPVDEVDHIDAQYDKVYRYRGVPLARVIARYSPPATVDLALLHFANGMVVPLPFREDRALTRLDPFLAFEVKLPGQRRFSRAFPPVHKKPDSYLDIRPISFTGNKLVVAERWHPSVPDTLAVHFSPWRHTDSLVGIELVQAQAYDRQFDVADAAQLKAGYAVFQQSCQFCHGLRKVGAAHGWDFVEPVPVSQWRPRGKRFFFHINYPRIDAKERGLMMPALRSIGETEADLLWQWLAAAADKPVRAYQPADRP